jgi:hypothetical protein
MRLLNMIITIFFLIFHISPKIIDENIIEEEDTFMQLQLNLLIFNIFDNIINYDNTCIVKYI